MTFKDIAQLWVDICTVPIGIGFIFAIANYLLDTVIQAAFGRRDRR